MDLIVVESPTKAKTLAKFLGSDYLIKASMGHVRDLPKSELGVDIDNDFKPKYVLVAGRDKTIEELKQAAKGAKQIILATDPDREGEAIAYHVAHILKEKSPEARSTSSVQARNKKQTNSKSQISNSQFSRIVFHEITKTAVEAALAHPGKVNMDLVHAQLGRRVLDRLVGYKLSPLLWRKVRRGLSAGRVQSVAVKLIVEREREIEAFKTEEYWEIGAELQAKSQKPKAKSGDFTVWLVKIGDEKAEVHDQKTADGVVGDLEKAKYQVATVVKKEVNKSPYPPYMTSTLQRAGANVLGWSSKKTMQVAQRLYERGLITYHRTDSLNISAEALKQVAKYIGETFGPDYKVVPYRVFRSTSRLAQEAHEAIRPTNVNELGIKNKELGENRDFQKLYQLIWKRFTASQMAKAVFDRTTISVTAEATRQKPTPVPVGTGRAAKSYLLRATGSTMKFEGWMKLYSKLDETEEGQRLPEVGQGDVLNKKKVLATQKFTEPLPRFNEASLIKALEEKGIGRPSTYAPIISTIQTRQYVEKKEQRFYPTAIGNAVTDFLVEHFGEIMDYDFTAGMEDGLDKIAEGKKDWQTIIKSFYGAFAKDVKDVEKNAKRVKVEVEKTGEKCPTCGKGEVVIRIGRFGKFLSCSKFPECKYTASYIEKVEGMKCPKDGGDIVVRRTKTGRHFFGCSNYPKCDWASWRKPK